jgi:hypothetical protein
MRRVFSDDVEMDTPHRRWSVTVPTSSWPPSGCSTRCDVHHATPRDRPHLADDGFGVWAMEDMFGGPTARAPRLRPLPRDPEKLDGEWHITHAG